jgi:hypothetical protein
VCISQQAVINAKWKVATENAGNNKQRNRKKKKGNSALFS